MLYDVFISHASEDKDSLVRPLAEALRDNHVEVWYDEFSLQVGDSLRRSIDSGLAKSRFGVVVLSPAFFAKEWPQWELNGLVARENMNRGALILPVWHNVSKFDVLAYSPSLADKVGISSEKGLNVVLQKLLETIQPQGSTLIKAREILLSYGFEPPVVTDDWWLDVVEFSGSDYRFNHWGFPLPASKGRGLTLAFAAMQMTWQEKNEYNPISQITHPEEVLNFIQTEPGLKEMCLDHLESLAAYVPQLTLRGFSGPFDEEFEKAYQKSVAKYEKQRYAQPESGTALTTNHLPPACDEVWAWRHPTFGDYRAINMACNFVQGELFGEHTKVYEIFDYLVWCLSNDSKWFPEEAKRFLISGFKQWNSWSWDKYEVDNIESDLSSFNSAGELFIKMFYASSPQRKSPFKLTKSCYNDIQGRITISCERLKLTDSVQDLLDRFLAEGFIEAWIKSERTKRMKHKY